MEHFTYKKNKMIPTSTRIELMAMRGFHSQEMELRHSGRSLAIAFRTIGGAMMHPGVPYAIIDHHESDNPCNYVHNSLARIIQMILESNGMKFFVIGKHPATGGPALTYEVFEEVRYTV